jgi:putative membrane protein
MGLANLVPGISGGTMLVAAGVYTRFIDAVSDLTRLRFKSREIILLATIIGGAGAALVGLSGPVKSAVINDRWVMYSLFIGLTLGGLPLLLRKARPLRPSVWVGAVAGVVAMSALAVAQSLGTGQGGPGDSGWLMLFIAGVAGASAMILPGVSGAYLLLVLGQYLAILGAIDRAKDALSAGDIAPAMDELAVFIPVGLGVLAGIAVVSNLLRYLLHKHEKPTLGVLIGLLVGSVVGLWPFQATVEPVPGETVIKNRLVTEENLAEFDTEDYPTELFAPSALQVGGSVALIGAGFGATLLIARLGRERPRRGRTPQPATDPLPPAPRGEGE